jgi:hypothetical protein
MLAIAALLTAAVTPTFGGYIIIRVLLEGGGDTGGQSNQPGGPPMGPGGLTPPTKPGGPPGGFNPGGFPGGPPGGFKPGMGGPPGMPGMFPGAGPSTAAHGEVDNTRAVVVVIPLEADLLEGNLEPKKNFHPDDNPRFRKFVAPYYGKKLKATLFVDSSTIQLYEQLLPSPAPKKTRHTQLLDKYAVWARGKKDPQVLYDAFVLALESGYIRNVVPPADGSPSVDAVTMAQELLDVAAENKSLPPAVDRFVKTWGPMSKAVRAPAPQPNDAAELWKERLSAKDVRTEGHYALIYWDSSEAEVSRRLRQLNDNFYAFYLWHATRGVTLPVPAKTLIAVLARQGGAMRGLNHTLDGMPIQADAFYAPDHDLVVLSPERLDSVGQTFLQQTQERLQNVAPDRLLEGLIPKLDHTGEKGAKPNEIARATTLAVVQKLVIDEAELAAVSREGTRQLLYATDQLPRHVTLPNWLTNGAVNFLARPRGPAYITLGEDDKPYMTVAMTTGYGVANYVLHAYWKDLLRDLDRYPVPKPGEAQARMLAHQARILENVLTDGYFAGIKNADDPDPALPPKNTKKTEPAPKTGPGAGLPFGPPGGPPFGPPGGPPGGMTPKRPPGAPDITLPGGFDPRPGSMRPGGPMSAGSPSDEEDPSITQRKKRERLTIKAQTTAWALYYYLAREQPELLKRYISELNKYPRDLPIDGQTAYRVFARVFGLAGADGRPDPEKLKTFANDWFERMKGVPEVGFNIPLVVPEPPKETTPGAGKPPMGPGDNRTPPGKD